MAKQKTWWKDRIDTHERMGPALKAARLQHEFTQKEVAEAIECTPSSISELERGHYGSLKLVEAYAFAIGVPLAPGLHIAAPNMNSLVITAPRKKAKSIGISAPGAAAIRWVHNQRKNANASMGQAAARRRK